jgi:hypothetical protein
LRSISLKDPPPYTVIANYNTTADVKQFLIFIARRNPHRTQGCRGR